jgi:hypothetical protein
MKDEGRSDPERLAQSFVGCGLPSRTAPKAVLRPDRTPLQRCAEPPSKVRGLRRRAIGGSDFRLPWRTHRGPLTSVWGQGRHRNQSLGFMLCRRWARKCHNRLSDFAIAFLSMLQVRFLPGRGTPGSARSRRRSMSSRRDHGTARRVVARLGAQVPPSAPFMMAPNRSQRSPVKRIICNCLMGAKSVGLVLTVIPGSSMGSARACRFAA